MSCWVLKFDWSAFGDVLSGLGAVAAGAATIWLAYYAAQGLSTWKHQLVGTRDIQLIDEILTCVYEIEEAYKEMTSSFTTSDDLNRVEKRENESDDEWQKRAGYSVLRLKYSDHSDSFNKLRALAFRAKAILGREVYALIVEIFVLPRRQINLGDAAYRAESRLEKLERQLQLGLKVNERTYLEAQNKSIEAHTKYWGLEIGNEPEAQMASLIQQLEALLDRRDKQ